MPRIQCTIQYVGTRYLGWQIQPDGPTVQEVIQKALFQILHQKIHVTASGRTDSGVHALAQVAHFDIPDGTAMSRLILSLNSILPDDISIIDYSIMDKAFHAQLSAKKKTYTYHILNSRIRNPFLSNYAWQIYQPLDLKLMKKAASLLQGEHDFKSFCASDATVQTTTRRIYRIKVSTGARPFLGLAPCPQLITISITGNGFLKHMVRNIVGTLVEVGKGSASIKDFKKILSARDRKQAGRTAPARGLFLEKVIYDPA